MTDYELLRIINFLERIRAPFDQNMHGGSIDPVWNMVLFLMKSHLRGDPVTMSSLASASNMPFPIAMRRIHRLIKDGEIKKRVNSKTGKSSPLLPNKPLKQNFPQYHTTTTNSHPQP